jgi:membrane-associated protease RseP (regulator of RpoE activity)
MTPFWIALAVVLFLGTIVAHEAGHYVAMRRAGVRIVSAGIGFPFPPTFTVYRKRNPDGTVTKFQLSPWVLGAFVRADDRDEKRIDELPYRQFTWMMGSGVVINLVLGAVFIGIGALMIGNWTGFLVYLAAATLLWLGRRLVAAYLVPVLGLPALGLMLWGTALAVAEHSQVGILGTARMFSMAESASLAFVLAGLLSAALGILNMVPLFPFDGGRIFSRVLTAAGLGSRGVLAFEVATSVLAVGTVTFTLLTDVIFA